MRYALIILSIFGMVGVGVIVETQHRKRQQPYETNLSTKHGPE